MALREVKKMIMLTHLAPESMKDYVLLKDIRIMLSSKKERY